MNDARGLGQHVTLRRSPILALSPQHKICRFKNALILSLYHDHRSLTSLDHVPCHPPSAVFATPSAPHVPIFAKRSRTHSQRMKFVTASHDTSHRRGAHCASVPWWLCDCKPSVNGRPMAAPTGIESMPRASRFPFYSIYHHMPTATARHAPPFFDTFRQNPAPFDFFICKQIMNFQSFPLTVKFW